MWRAELWRGASVAISFGAILCLILSRRQGEGKGGAVISEKVSSLALTIADLDSNPGLHEYLDTRNLGRRLIALTLALPLSLAPQASVGPQRTESVSATSHTNKNGKVASRRLAAHHAWRVGQRGAPKSSTHRTRGKEAIRSTVDTRHWFSPLRQCHFRQYCYQAPSRVQKE